MAQPRALGKVDALIAVLLVAQILIPLRYYLGEDTYDERFSWRMFSAVRVVQCDTQAFETQVGGMETLQDLPRLMHTGWIENMRRNRDVVMRAYLRRRCAEPDMAAVRVVNNCVGPDGKTMPSLTWTRACATGEERDP